MDNSLECERCGRYRTVPLAIAERYGAPGRDQAWHCGLARKEGGLERGCKTPLNREERPPQTKEKEQRQGSAWKEGAVLPVAPNRIQETGQPGTQRAAKTTK